MNRPSPSFLHPMLRIGLTSAMLTAMLSSALPAGASDRHHAGQPGDRIACTDRFRAERAERSPARAPTPPGRLPPKTPEPQPTSTEQSPAASTPAGPVQRRRQRSRRRPNGASAARSAYDSRDGGKAFTTRNDKG